MPGLQAQDRWSDDGRMKERKGRRRRNKKQGGVTGNDTTGPCLIIITARQGGMTGYSHCLGVWRVRVQI